MEVATQFLAITITKNEVTLLMAAKLLQDTNIHTYSWYAEDPQWINHSLKRFWLTSYLPLELSVLNKDKFY